MLALVIDDSRSMRMILRRVLTEIGCEVIEADNGRAALDLLLALDRVPDIALVDWNMPQLNGLEFVAAVRADVRWLGMSLMMVTTESELGQITRAYDAGADEYVIKPFTADTILTKLGVLGLLQAA